MSLWVLWGSSGRSEQFGMGRDPRLDGLVEVGGEDSARPVGISTYDHAREFTALGGDARGVERGVTSYPALQT